MSLGPYSQKLADKHATSQPVIAEQKTVDGRDPQIAAVMARADAAHTREGNTAVGAAHDRADSAFSRAGHNHPYASDNHGHSAYTTEAEVKALIPNSTGPTRAIDRQMHSHSISSTTFIKRSREERKRMLTDRQELERALYDGHLCYEEEVIARNVANLLSLLMDYREMDAFERERRLEDPEWEKWAEEYKRVYGVDEYAEEDRSNFLNYGRVRMDPYEGIAPVAD